MLYRLNSLIVATFTISLSSAAPQRDQLKSFLQEQGVGTEIYYPLSMHEQVCFSDLGYKKGDFPESERAAADSLAIPVHSALAVDDMEYIAERIREFYARA